MKLSHRIFKFVPFIAGSAMLSACTQIVESGKQVATSGTVAAHSTKDKVTELLTYRPPKPPAVPAVPPSYCYRVMQDIICYQEPRQNSGQLVAYQSSVMEGGTLAPVPPPKMTVKTTVGAASPGMVVPKEEMAAAKLVPLVTSEVEKSPKEQAAQKEKTEKSMAKYEDVKPVFVDAAPAVKANTKPTPVAPVK